MEALVILLVPLVALLIWTVAFFQNQPLDVVTERARVDQHIAWLEERLEHARRKNWDEDMVGRLLAQLAEARREQRALLGG
ncbi:MAG TPA: hypothetical protein VHN79_04755 [Lacunisphaera sp.]|nr:hypothetical protein [Lacunisphaera sp.]